MSADHHFNIRPHLRPVELFPLGFGTVNMLAPPMPASRRIKTWVETSADRQTKDVEKVER
jgi:hypothetical protein